MKEFGTDHIYNTDTFNEMTPKSNSSKYLAAASQAVYQGMIAADPQAVWLMQGWLFQSSAFWKTEQIKSYITAVPQGRLIILDLMSEISPRYDYSHSYFGQPWIWCMLHNFGGNDALYGAVEPVNKEPFAGRMYPNSTMIGTGLTPEGINQNDVIYEFMNENAFRTSPRDIPTWMENYATRRYGAYSSQAGKAWQLLGYSVYNCTTGYEDFSSDVHITRRPRLNPPLNPAVWYQPEDLYQAWDNMIQAAVHLPHSKLFVYDLVDVSRQSLQIISSLYYNQLIDSYNKQDLAGVMKAGKGMVELLGDLDQLLGTCDQFLLGRWIADAHRHGTSTADRDLFEFNARNQITLWGPNANILDYAGKQWSGLVKSYYQPRWSLFVWELQIAVSENRTFNQDQYNDDVFRLVEEPFSYDRTAFPVEPMGDPIYAATKMNNKYRPITKEYAEFFHSLQTWDASHVVHVIGGISGSMVQH